MEGAEVEETSNSVLVSHAVNALRLGLRRRGLVICISGIDGSGKTTLARNLVEVLTASGVPVSYLHVHQWYLNVLLVPILVIYNRFLGRKLLIFDRTIFDNIAVISIRRHCPRWLFRAVLAPALLCYPGFDYRFYLVVAFAETLSRRPDTNKQRFTLLSRVYDEIAGRALYIRLQSDKHLFAAVLRKIAAEA